MADAAKAADPRRNDAPCRRILAAADHYAVLAVPRSADESQVKSEYRKLAREVHPDKNPSPLAAEAFKRLSKANEILLDASTRKDYDRFGESPPQCQRPRQYHQHRSGGVFSEQQGDPGVKVLMALLPIVVMMLVSSGLGSFIRQGDASGKSQGGPWGQPQNGRQGTTRPKPKPEPVVTELSRSKAESQCFASGRMCGVLLLKAGKAIGSREEELVNSFRSASRGALTSSGQMLRVAWTTTAAVRGWKRLIPEGATLPWVVVLKSSRGSLRAAAVPLPKGGGKVKRRLSEGVPTLLKDIASGEARFTSLKGSIADLFA